jgi:hypothetical protein
MMIREEGNKEAVKIEVNLNQEPMAYNNAKIPEAGKQDERPQSEQCNLGLQT